MDTPILLQQKKCRECGQTKDSSCFAPFRHVCKECKRVYYRAWRAANQDKLRDDKQRWKDENRERSRKSNRISAAKARAADPERFRETARRWQSKNPEKKREALRKWQAAHGADSTAARRSQTRANGGKITGDEWALLKAKYDYTCLCCGRKEPEIKLTLDHVIPIVLGGKNIISNAQPLCRSCNCQKHKKETDYRQNGN